MTTSGLRIAYVCADPGVPVFGTKGCSVHVREVVRAMRGAGADVHLFASRGGGERPADLRDLPVHVLPEAPRGDLSSRERAALDANAAVSTALARAGPFDCVYERYALWSFAGMEHAAAAGIPGVLEVNAPLVEEQARFRGLADREAAEAIEWRTFEAAGAVVAVSPAVAAYVRSRGGGGGRVHVLPNGVDATRFRPDVPPALPQVGGFTVGFVGSMKPWHGLEVLIPAFERAWKVVPGARLLLVGDGAERARVADLARACGFAHAVHMTGGVEADRIPGMLASMDVGVAPYPATEGFYFSPLKVYEYMAAGLPVVASRAGMLDGLIEDGVSGLLVPPGDEAALAAALVRLHGDPALRRRLGAEARARVVASHTWDAVVGRIFAIAGLRPAEALVVR